MNDLRVPVLPVARSRGYDPAYVATGAFRTMPYDEWLERKMQEQHQNGGRFRAGADYPERKPDGTVDGISHRAESPEEIISVFSKMLRAADTLEEDRKKAAAASRITALQAEIGDLAKRAAAGDGEALMTAIARSMQARATDPNILPQPYVAPGDFAAQYATPLDTTELIALCEETGLWRALPEHVEDTHTELWRELTELDFVSGCNMIAFEKGGCPEEYQHTGHNLNIPLKHIGVKKTLAESDILHSMGSIAAGYGINRLIGGFADNGLPGENDLPTLVTANIASLKEKEARLGSTLTLNGWDQLLVDGDATGNPEEFDGLTNLITAALGARANGGTSTGTFNVNHFDQFISAGCAKPDAIIGHPTALAAISLAYFGLGSGTLFYDQNAAVVPGLHFAGEIMTGIGPVALIGDSRFPRTVVGADATFSTTVYPVKRRHNGEDLIYKRTQIPLSYKDLAPGCSAVSFEIWAVTALVVKAMCAQALYKAVFNGLVDDGCTYVHPCIS